MDHIQKYLQWHTINFQDEHPIHFDFFQELKDTHEFFKADVQSKEFISKEDI